MASVQPGASATLILGNGASVGIGSNRGSWSYTGTRDGVALPVQSFGPDQVRTVIGPFQAGGSVTITSLDAEVIFDGQFSSATTQTMQAGASAPVSVAPGGRLTVSSNGGMASVTGTIPNGVTVNDYFGPGPFRKVYAGFQATGTLTVQAQTGAVTWDLYTPPSPPQALSRFTAAIANRNNAPVVIVFIGDSWNEYRTVSAFGQQYTQLLPQQLRSKYPTAGIGSGGGIGYVPIQNISIFAPYTNPWVLGGSFGAVNVASGGLGIRYAVFGAGQTATITVRGTSCKLHYLKGNSSRVGYYKVDGGATVPFETNGGTGAVTDDGELVINFGASGTHTLEVGYSSGGQVYLAGAIFFDGDENKGFHVYEGGHTAYRTTDYLPGAPGADALHTRIATLNPHVVPIPLGQNDFAQGAGLFISAAQFKANLKAIIAALRAKGVTAAFPLVMSADVTAIKNAGQTSSWADFQQAAREVAAEDTGGPFGQSGVSFVSITDTGLIPASPGGAGGKWIDGAHVGAVGHIDVSSVFFGALAR